MSRCINQSIRQVSTPAFNQALNFTKSNFQFSTKLNQKSISPVELVSETFPRLRSFNEKFNAFITLTEDVALKQAEELAHKISAGDKLPLEGAMVAVKDNFCTKGVPTTCASQ